MIFLPNPLRRFPLLPGCLLFWAACSNAGEQTQPVWKYPPDLPGAKVHVYKRVGPVELKAWVFNPPETFPSRHRPAIVFFFGGGWKGGTPGQFYPQCRYLASRGMVALTVDYRVKGRHGVPVGACLEDAKSAIRWVRENAIQLGIDPDRVVASGGSAGGHLAAALAMVPGFEAKGERLEVSSRPNAMALYNPAVILGKVDGKQQLPAEKIEDLRKRTANRIQQLSPYQHVQSGLPPSIIFHGSEDQAVPLWTVRKFQEALKAKRNRCELKIYGGAPHGFFNTGRPASEEKMDREQQWYASTTRQLDQFLISLGYLDGQPAIVACEKNHLNLRTDFSRSLANDKGVTAGN